MDQSLNTLSQAEITALKDAHAYITILIAGADGNIDKHEVAWAEKIIHFRTVTGEDSFKDFHDAVDAELPSKIKELMASLPNDPKTRSEIISEKLAKLNPILASLPPATGFYLYKGYTTFALRIARSSGGILSFFTIGVEEKKWIDLPMLDPIHFDPDEEK